LEVTASLLIGLTLLMASAILLLVLLLSQAAERTWDGDDKHANDDHPSSRTLPRSRASLNMGRGTRIRRP
jgi:hypothetical protein